LSEKVAIRPSSLKPRAERSAESVRERGFVFDDRADCHSGGARAAPGVPARSSSGVTKAWWRPTADPPSLFRNQRNAAPPWPPLCLRRLIRALAWESAWTGRRRRARRAQDIVIFPADAAVAFVLAAAGLYWGHEGQSRCTRKLCLRGRASADEAVEPGTRHVSAAAAVGPTPWRTHVHQDQTLPARLVLKSPRGVACMSMQEKCE